MKQLNSLTGKFLPTSEPKLVHFVAVLGGWKRLDAPVLSSQINCPICDGSEHYTPLVDPLKGPERVRICGKLDCVTNTDVKRPQATPIAPPSQRALSWADFMARNGIGDKHAEVRFEDIQQAQAKISYLLKFAEKPRDIILMQGSEGTGKTYAAMGLCELYCRTRTRAVFTTQKRMFTDWTETFNKDYINHYISSVTNCELLVIDDFGIGEISPSFMGFIFELIDQRLQWTNRGTVITTNLDAKQMGIYCGQALADRINTGQVFQFSGKTRRVNKPL
jgi:DNA replication protein DnaC